MLKKYLPDQIQLEDNYQEQLGDLEDSLLKQTIINPNQKTKKRNQKQQSKQDDLSLNAFPQCHSQQQQSHRKVIIRKGQKNKQQQSEQLNEDDGSLDNSEYSQYSSQKVAIVEEKVVYQRPKIKEESHHRTYSNNDNTYENKSDRLNSTNSNKSSMKPLFDENGNRIDQQEKDDEEDGDEEEDINNMEILDDEMMADEHQQQQDDDEGVIVEYNNDHSVSYYDIEVDNSQRYSSRNSGGRVHSQGINRDIKQEGENSNSKNTHANQNQQENDDTYFEYKEDEMQEEVELNNQSQFPKSALENLQISLFDETPNTQGSQNQSQSSQYHNDSPKLTSFVPGNGQNTSTLDQYRKLLIQKLEQRKQNKAYLKQKLQICRAIFQGGQNGQTTSNGTSNVISNDSTLNYLTFLRSSLYSRKQQYNFIKYSQNQMNQPQRNLYFRLGYTSFYKLSFRMKDAFQPEFRLQNNEFI